MSNNKKLQFLCILHYFDDRFRNKTEKLFFKNHGNRPYFFLKNAFTARKLNIGYFVFQIPFYEKKAKIENLSFKC